MAVSAAGCCEVAVAAHLKQCCRFIGTRVSSSSNAALYIVEQAPNVSKPWAGLSSYVFQLRLMNAFSSAKNSSIGLRSGEYGGRYMSFTPALAHIYAMRSVWWKDALSITSTDLGASHLPQC